MLLREREIDSAADGFVDAVFRLDVSIRMPPCSLTKRDYVARTLRGGYPEAVVQSMANDIALPRRTLSLYLDLLELIFVIKRIPAWSSNLTTRAISTPKLIVTDSGLGGRLIGMSEERAKDPTAPVGPLLENFAIGEVARQLTWTEERLTALPMAALWTLDSSAPR
jgi:uncharacterized protein